MNKIVYATIMIITCMLSLNAKGKESSLVKENLPIKVNNTSSGSSANVKVVCIEGYKFVVAGTYRGVSIVQMFHSSRDSHTPKPTKCK